MEARSQEDQEREIRDLLRQAERKPLKSPARRNALKRLIDLAHSPYPKLKAIAAHNLKTFITDFPDLEDDAINAVYDLCEDPVTKVRISGYAAIVDVSREQLKWVKRNADVLVQLLQSDEPDEVTYVKRALNQHLDMDPATTLGVLCDQIIPMDEPLDEEEQIIRSRLRSLVLSFMTGEAKRAIIDRHTSTPGSVAEETLVMGLLKAVEKLTPADVDVIVKEILLALPSFKPSSPRSKQLLEVVLDRTKALLKSDLSSGSDRSPLTNVRYWLDLAAYIALENRVAHPSDLLRFYFTTLSSRMMLLRLDEDAQFFVLSRIADALSAYEKGPPEGSSSTHAEDALLRKQTPDICVVLLQIFSEANAAQRPWKACRTFLRTCLRHKKEYKWTVPSHLLPILQSIQGSAEIQAREGRLDNVEDIQSLIRSLLQPVSKPMPVVSKAPAAAVTNTSEGMSSSSATVKSERRIMNVKRKREGRPAGLPPRPVTTPPANGNGSAAIGARPEQGKRASVEYRQRATTVPATVGTQESGHSIPSDDQPRATKRAKKGGGVEGAKEVPSLLSRLETVTMNDKASVERAASILAGKRRVESAPVLLGSSQETSSDVDMRPVEGYSIKGAATRVTSPDDLGPIKTSLLDRLQSASIGRGVGGQMKKRRTRS
ncbi:uncharacterized protein LAESUDRAFT_721349 [Laetiporus sulphureus 93-53]|uniref:ARM repeat-containing protein n=1 Tax=Laetiporus sulphureus 93-53 TaxID=1314785 RepID=A0A165GWX9_9APHY|nr:uncharacterized protein LAESUDRAFT_721349 [Laetiporus sulphureus 93-53]KZT10939.1 hypothetical protein LAESUDRAFT_721349 [Laetiporus sulphureus 93-53]